jgi:hypothetical protein
MLAADIAPLVQRAVIGPTRLVGLAAILLLDNEEMPGWLRRQMPTEPGEPAIKLRRAVHLR